MTSAPFPVSRIPLPDPRVFHGLAGDAVRLLDPFTEAAPIGVHLHLMVAVASAMGPGPHFVADDCRHALSLNLAVVGCSAAARKGVSWRRAHKLVAEADPDWAAHCVATGLADVAAVERTLRDRVAAAAEAGEGAADLRLLIFESELGRAIDAALRPGNDLARLLRVAWEQERFKPLGKRGVDLPAQSHVCVVGHIGFDQLQERATPRFLNGGFADRFVWTVVDRSKSLPDGRGVDGGDDDAGGGGELDEGYATRRRVLVERLRAAIRFGQRTGRMTRDDDAAALWRENYEALTQATHGPLASLGSRSSPLAMRLACLYALLDESRTVRRDHLLAALLLVGYSMASAEWAFQDHAVHRLALRIFSLISAEPNGVSRTRIRDFLNRNGKGAEIDEALRQLSARGLVEGRTTKGRSFNQAETWFPTLGTGEPPTSAQPPAAAAADTTTPAANPLATGPAPSAAAAASATSVETPDP